MHLTVEQKRRIFTEGYVVVPGVVPGVMVDAALRGINCALGEGIPREELDAYRSRSFAPDLQREPVIADLYNATPARALAESAIGAGKIAPVTGGQIALRFPTMADPPGPPGPHLDGMHSPTNGVPFGEIHNFTMLVGVLLSDVPCPWSGNLAVWPGSHRLYEDYFRANDPQSLLDGMPPVALPEPVQITGRAGDVVLVHYEIAHGVATNVSPHIRYAIYFRLAHVDHAAMKWETMTDLWLEWEGMREIVGASVEGTVGVR